MEPVPETCIDGCARRGCVAEDVERVEVRLGVFFGGWAAVVGAWFGGAVLGGGVRREASRGRMVMLVLVGAEGCALGALLMLLGGWGEEKGGEGADARSG